MTGKIEAADWGAAKPRPGGRETAGPLAWIRRRFDPFLRFRRDEDGGPSVEFVLVFPMFMILVASACETGILLTRQMMLQHGTELAARAIRLGTAEQVSHSDIRTMVCDGAGIVPDCQNQLKVEMIRLDPDNWQAPPAQPDCVDRNEPGIPNRSFQHGAEHDLMLVRICALFDPVFPYFGHGQQIKRDRGDHYALVSNTIFVMEPG